MLGLQRPTGAGVTDAWRVHNASRRLQYAPHEVRGFVLGLQVSERGCHCASVLLGL